MNEKLLTNIIALFGTEDEFDALLDTGYLDTAIRELSDKKLLAFYQSNFDLLLGWLDNEAAKIDTDMLVMLSSILSYSPTDIAKALFLDLGQCAAAVKVGTVKLVLSGVSASLNN